MKKYAEDDILILENFFKYLVDLGIALEGFNRKKVVDMYLKKISKEVID